ncbi:MAG: YraN family protein [Bacteroidales bacterium]|nr:YraN family protein [Bacteroidales bacterium]
MKNENLEKGKKGEDLAWEYLESQGYRLLERNLHWGHLEIDLVVENDDFIVFVEVKTRKNNMFGEPETFVTLQKQRNMIRAANGYVLKMGIRKEVRFDVVSVILDEGVSSVKHIQDSFKPRW